MRERFSLEGLTEQEGWKRGQRQRRWRQWQQPMPHPQLGSGSLLRHCYALNGPHLLQMGLLLGTPAQQNVGKTGRGIGRPGTVASGATVGSCHQIPQIGHIEVCRASQ